MGGICTICTHPDRDAIDLAIVSGVSQRATARQWCVSRDAVQRHALRHVSPALAAMQAEREREGATSLLNRVENLIGRTEKLLEAAEQDGKVSAALAAVRELRGLLELLGKASGELDTRPVTNVINLQTSPEWQQMRAVIFATLMQFPEAREVVTTKLRQLEAGPS